MAKDRRFDRKSFFREGPRSLVRAFFEGMGEAAKPPPARAGAPLLRPPGAAAGKLFLELCSGGADCARVCPADAILMLPREDDPARSAPCIQPEIAACVLCNELSCMKACPSGALRPVPRGEIRIGIARVSEAECLAWTNQDPECRECAEKCPVGADAIWMEEEGGRPRPFIGGACVGCGVCEYACPAYPPAVRVYERPEATGAERGGPHG